MVTHARSQAIDEFASRVGAFEALVIPELGNLQVQPR